MENVDLPKLEKQLAETTGLFKGKERKALSAQIERMQREIERRKYKIPGILKEDGYPDAQAFMRMYNKATEIVEQYNRDLAAWERQVKGEKQPQRNRLKKRASVRNSGIWRQRSSGGTTHGGSRPDLAATIMTEDAKTEKYTAGSPCGAYIGS